MLQTIRLCTDENRTEEAYKKNVTTLFKSLDRVEKALAESSTPYLLSSSHITEADVRLFTTIIRFDPVYVQHFKCNIRDSTLRIHLVPKPELTNYSPLRISIYSPLGEALVLGLPQGVRRDDRVRTHQESLHQEPRTDQLSRYYTGWATAQHPRKRRRGTECKVCTGEVRYQTLMKSLLATSIAHHINYKGHKLV